RDGVGLNKLQFTTRIPISLGLTLLFSNSSSKAPNITISSSAWASFMDVPPLKLSNHPALMNLLVVRHSVFSKLKDCP
ncbi:hypothetical protein KI387_020893, partial [Taxus chinensis]